MLVAPRKVIGRCCAIRSARSGEAINKLRKHPYLLVTAIVAIAANGCILSPAKTTFDAPGKPSEIKAGKTSKATVQEQLGNPRQQTADGRVAVHDYSRTTRLWIITYIPDVSESTERLLSLVVYDKNDIAERFQQYKCADPQYKSVCESQDPVCGLVVAINDLALVNRYCDKAIVEHFRKLALIDSLEKPLREAIRRGDLETIKRLVDQGADFVRLRREPLLVEIAAKRANVAVVELLLDNGVELNEKPLLVAVKNSHLELVETLLARGAEVNAGWETPLYRAATNNDVTIARLLLSAGADVNIGGRGNEPPLHVALARGNTAVAQLLLDHGASVNLVDHLGKTPLRIAVKRGEKEMVELLKRYGAKE